MPSTFSLWKLVTCFVNRCFSAFHIYCGDYLCCNCNKCIMFSRNYSRKQPLSQCSKHKGLPIFICSFLINWLRNWFSIKLSARSKRLLFSACSVCYLSSQAVFKCNKSWRCVAWWKQVHWMPMFCLGELKILNNKSRPGVAPCNSRYSGYNSRYSGLLQVLLGNYANNEYENVLEWYFAAVHTCSFFSANRDSKLTVLVGLLW